MGRSTYFQPSASIPRRGAQPRLYAAEYASKYDPGGDAGSRGPSSEDPVQPAGFWSPATRRMVGAMSTCLAGASTAPDGMVPGIQITRGTRSVASYAKRPCVASP